MSIKPGPSSGSSSTEPQIDPIVLKCEAFINEQLRNDLKIIHMRQENIHVQLNNFDDLKSFIIELQNTSFGPGKSIKTQIDVGHNFYMRCTM